MIDERADNRANAFKEQFEQELLDKINESAEKRDSDLKKEIAAGIANAFRQ